MFRRLALALTGAAALFAAAMTAPAAAQELIMVEEQGCIWCERWNEEIGPIYPKTAEGRTAPLRRLDIADPVPDGMEFAAEAFYTPTFILIVDGREAGRIEGYPGEDFFWGLLGRLLRENTDFGGAT